MASAPPPPGFPLNLLRIYIVKDVGFRILEWIKKVLFKPKTLMERFTCIINTRILLPKKIYEYHVRRYFTRKTYEKHFQISRMIFGVPYLSDLFQARESKSDHRMSTFSKLYKHYLYAYERRLG